MKIILILLIGAAAFKVFFMYLEQKSLYYPDKDVLQTPKDMGIEYQEVNLKTTDGQTVNGWFIPAANAKVTIIYCHGNAGNIYHRLQKIKFFHEMGLNLLIFDYRGYGKSSGRPNEQGFYKDAQAAYDFIVRKAGIKENKIVVYGKSLGAAVAADLCLSRKADALILESGLSSVAILGQELYPFLPVKLFVSQKYDTIQKLRDIRIPKLILHGRNDEVIAFRHSQMLYDAAALPKEFLPFDGGHNDDVFVTSGIYREKMNKFFLENHIL